MALDTRTYKDASGTTQTRVVSENASGHDAGGVVLLDTAAAALVGQKARAASVPVTLSTEDVAAIATQATLAAVQTLLGAGLPSDLVGGRLSVDGSGVTQPVSAASLPLPTGAATQATLAAIQTLVDALTTPSDTQPISAASLPLPAGAATQATLASVLSALQAALTVTATNLDIRDLSSAIDSVAVTDGGGSLTVDGTVTATGPLTDAELRATAVPVSAASLPLPSGAATAANQATLIGHVDGIETLLSGTLTVDGSGVTQPVSGTVTANLAAGTSNIGDVDVLSLPALPAGTNNIGDVDIASIAAGDNNIGNVDVVTLPALVAGEAHVGEVGGRARLLTDSYTRPADTTTYAVGDALAESTSAPTALEFANAARVSGGSGEITGLVVVTSTAAATALAGELWVFAGASAPTATNDNAAFNPSDSDALNVVAVIPFSVGSAGSSNRVYDVGPLACPYVCNATSLWGLVRVTNAYVPASAEVVTLGLRVRQN